MPRTTAHLAHLAGPFGLVLAATALVSFAAVGPGCDSGKEHAYKPRPAPSGKAAKLPTVPTLSNKPKKNGDVYTVAGLIHDFRSRIHGEKLLSQESVTVVGYIVKTNLGEAPPCAVHKTGKKDGPDCEKNPPPVPALWISDEKGAAENVSIPVMGWAGNYADIYDAIQAYKKPKVKELTKNKWGTDVPNPIPNKDAKIKVVGKYGTSFTLASQGVESNPVTGIITYKSIEYVEPPPTPGTLPGVKLRLSPLGSVFTPSVPGVKLPLPLSAPSPRGRHRCRCRCAPRCPGSSDPAGAATAPCREPSRSPTRTAGSRAPPPGSSSRLAGNSPPQYGRGSAPRRAPRSSGSPRTGARPPRRSPPATSAQSGYRSCRNLAASPHGRL